MRWSASADLTGMAPGTVLARGATMTAEVTGLPLGTAGATVTYTGTYADGRVEINNVTLSRPVPSCADLAPVATTAPEVTTTVDVTTTVAVAPETTATADTEFSVSGEVNSATATTVDSGQVLGEEETATTVATLANTGGRSNRALALTALALLTVGAGLAWSTVQRRTRESS